MAKKDRVQLIAGNWKMYQGAASGVELAKQVAKQSGNETGVQVVIAPPATILAAAATAVAGSKVEVA
ncbi:MAG TPA: triose-phosphate isomerase, partial [Polyangiaceae bacterium]|nr:triose-phosphate isomerase [Polyangiaceae bacterium]